MVSVKCAEVFFGDSRGVAGRNRLVRQRYNIHSSIHDPRATTIKKITELEGEPRVEGYIRTTAIKSKNLFAPLYFKLSPDLASDRYSSFETAGRKHISLGAYNPRNFTLLYAVFVGKRDAQFLDSTFLSKSLSYRLHDIGKFRLVFLYSFLNIPSHHSGRSIHAGVPARDAASDTIPLVDMDMAFPAMGVVCHALTSFKSLADFHIDYLCRTEGPELEKSFSGYPFDFFPTGLLVRP